MALVTTIHLPNTPPSTNLHASLFTNLQNAPFLHQQLLAGNKTFEYAFLDPTKLLSTTHVLAAIFRAINDQTHNRLKTHNVHAEVVFSLSPNNNIAESFRRFGIQPGSTSVLAVKIGTADTPEVTAESVGKFLAENVQGESVGFEDAELAQSTDWAAVRKIYKLNAPVLDARGKKANAAGGGNDRVALLTSQEEVQEMEMVILGIMALKGS